MRRGAALPTVLLALGLVAALAVGGAFVTRRYDVDAALLQRSSDLAPVTEEVLVRTAATLDTAALAVMPTGIGVELVTPVGPRPAGVATRLWLTRLSPTILAITAESRTTSKPLLRIRLGMTVRADSTGVMPLGQRAWTALP